MTFSPTDICKRAAISSLAEMILRVREPQPEEYDHIREGQIFFNFFHLASSESLTKSLMKAGAICIAYETIQKKDGHLPLLTPMSEVAGPMAIQQGAHRRGANMAILRVDHPDILHFIRSKSDQKALNNFNISVALTDRFMEALENEEEGAVIEDGVGLYVGLEAVDTDVL